MAKDGKKVAIGGGLILAIGLVYAATRKAKAISPENIVVSNLVVEPTQVYVGEPVSISVVAANIGETAGSYEVICEVI